MTIASATILIFLVIGAIAGYVADQVVPGNKLGILGSIVVGCIGGLIGGFIMGILPTEITAYLGTFMTSLIAMGSATPS